MNEINNFKNQKINNLHIIFGGNQSDTDGPIDKNKLKPPGSNND